MQLKKILAEKDYRTKNPPGANVINICKPVFRKRIVQFIYCESLKFLYEAYELFTKKHILRMRYNIGGRSHRPRERPSASQIVSIASAPEFLHLADSVSIDQVQ